MKKWIAALCSLSLSASAAALPFQGISASAKEIADTLPYRFAFQPSATSVSADDVAAGDVVISLPMYLYGSTANKVGAVSVKYQSSDSHLYFQNMRTGNTKLDAAQDFTSSQGTYSTSYVPFCFGKIDPRGKYVNGSPMITTNEIACDPIFGKTLTSNGDGGVKFTASYKTSSDSEKVSQEFNCDVTIDENGNGIYTYDYVDQTTFLTTTATGTIPRFNPDLPADTQIPDACNSYLWLPGSGDLADGASFFGDTSSEFPLFQVDLVVEQGTPCGIYNISFRQDVSPITGSACQMTSAHQQDYAITYQNTAIAVGVESAVVTEVVKNDAVYYAAHDTHAITGADFASKIIADVTYSDGTTESGVDITNLVSCSGATPAELFTTANGGYFSTDVPLCIGTTVVKRSDGSNLTQRIVIGNKGDVDFDGAVSMLDAYNTLMYNSIASAGGTPVFCKNPVDEYQENLAFFLADVDTCSTTGTSGGAISMTDAYQILMVNSYQSAGSKLPWDSLMK